ncbi:NAD(P)/FAD-dependent oxidoreductase [Rhizobium alvei]|uniref:NAD(P)/FAD-dependent oxidoreductase n=1 Tax=Rhizobium alvei TaxID=1132659 RepID=A0ABT8YKZ5_9HYPH|nr:NAD(P)/FAD-dependent oxidoreductase [Rhizobium alvei]MDO6964347.1 NAD(P)/FAD-dependent oxidoreductase [Rhizobium alvei]
MTGTTPPLKIAVIGSGISGLSAAWLLSKKHDVRLYETDSRPGGHSNTVVAETAMGPVPVDTGFIVFNEVTYPNLTALFKHLDVKTVDTEMSFAVSLDHGKLEYSGTDLAGIFAQKSNLVNLRFLSMLRDILRFYREAPADLELMGLESLDSYLDRKGYGRAFRDDHLYPMAAAIWSTPAGSVGAYPAKSFVRFCENHGLLKVSGRPIWKTVKGGSRNYVNRMLSEIGERPRLNCGVHKIVRQPHGVSVIDETGQSEIFDHVVLACHADQALAMIARPTPSEQSILGAFRYSVNEAVLHSDRRLMPKRKRAWSSWNYLADRSRADALSVTYWMNRLQGIDPNNPLFLSLNPLTDPDPAQVHYRVTYEHPMFDHHAISAQQRLWSLQGHGGVWFAGAYFGAGFHEDGLQAGLAVAEQLGDVRRPWSVANESGRIVLGDHADAEAMAAE